MSRTLRIVPEISPPSFVGFVAWVVTMYAVVVGSAQIGDVAVAIGGSVLGSDLLPWTREPR